MLLLLGPDDGDLSHPQWLYSLSPPSRTYEANFAKVHEDSVAGLTDELHVVENGEIVSVFQVSPDALLGVGDAVKSGGVWSGKGAAGDGGDEAGAEEDAENAEVLR